MTFEVLIENAAASEIREAFNWYNEKSIQTSANFQIEVERLIHRVQNDTLDYHEVLPGVKMAPLKSFPYNLYYRRLIEKELVQIIALLHTKRNPDFVSNRLSGT